MLLNDPGTFIRRPSQETFYRNFAPKALKNGWLRINAIQSQGEIQAIQLGYVCSQTYLQMQEGFNPDFVKGVGNALRHHTIRQCINEDLHEYDFLGGFTEHKRRWGATKRKGHDVLIGNQSLKSRLLIKMNIWPTGRYLIQQELID
jgi:CelD/BcsL family acetyltransferase involved in cellulose biosynthesis